MRHLMLIKIKNEGYEAGEAPPPALEAAMGQLMDQWTKASVLVSAEGLLPPSQGARVCLSNGKVTVQDAGFGAASEVVGGFFIFKTDTKEQALELTKAFLALHQDLMGPEFECECELRALEG